MLRVKCCTSLTTFWKIMYLDLEMFNDNLFIWSHSFIFRSSAFNEVSTLSLFVLSLKVLVVLVKVVSSANMMTLNISLAFSKSFIKIINNSGPLWSDARHSVDAHGCLHIIAPHSSTWELLCLLPCPVRMPGRGPVSSSIVFCLGHLCNV